MRWFSKALALSLCFIAIASAQTLGPPGGGGSSLPTPVSTTNGGTGVAGTLTGARKANGASPDTQAACADLSNAAASCATDATNATNISTGTLASARGGVDTTAWTGFTPSPSCGTATFTTNSARFKTIGKSTFVQVDFTVTAIGTCTQTVIFTLPVTPNSSGALTGTEIGVSNLVLTCRIASGSTNSSCLQTAATNFLLNAHVVASGVFENQ